MKDAIGNPIETGRVYGYSRNENGFTHVRIGKAVKINARTVTLEVQSAKISLYGGELKDVECAKKVSIRPLILFPIPLAQ